LTSPTSTTEPEDVESTVWRRWEVLIQEAIILEKHVMEDATSDKGIVHTGLGVELVPVLEEMKTTFQRSKNIFNVFANRLNHLGPFLKLGAVLDRTDQDGPTKIASITDQEVALVALPSTILRP
jgi:hypothetical protein